VSNRIGRIALAFLVLALAAGSVAIPASAEHGGAVVAKSKCKKKAKRAAAAKKKKCKRGGSGGAATSLPGQATHPTVTPPVTTPAVHMSALVLTDNPVLGGRSTQGQVTISGKAPSAGQPVTLVSTDPTVSVPGAVNVAAGLTKATFPVTTSAGPTVTVAITASIGTSSKQVFLKVVQEPSVKSVSLAYKCFPDVGLVDFGTNRVTLDVPAAADSPVDLTSSDPSALTTVPSTVTVQAGSSSATFGVSTGLLAVDSPPGVAVTGSLTGAFGTTQATSALSSIRDSGSPAPVVVGISATPTNVPPSSSVTGKVTLNCEAPSPDGTTVTLVSSNPSEVTVPPTVVVPADALSATFPIHALPGATGTATITATPDDGTPRQVVVTVTTILPT
jgi:hypothetical protein